MRLCSAFLYLICVPWCFQQMDAVMKDGSFTEASTSGAGKTFNVRPTFTKTVIINIQTHILFLKYRGLGRYTQDFSRRIVAIEVEMT